MPGYSLSESELPATYLVVELLDLPYLLFMKLKFIFGN